MLTYNIKPRIGNNWHRKSTCQNLTLSSLRGRSPPSPPPLYGSAPGQHLLPAAGPTIDSLVFLLSIVHDLLGVFIDSDVSMRTRVQRIASRCFNTLRQLRIAFGDKCQAPCSSRSSLRLFSVGWTGLL